MPTQLKTRCPHCQNTVKVSESHVGKNVRCPACKQAFEVSSVEAALSGSASLERAPTASETMNERAADTKPVPSDHLPPQPAKKQSSSAEKKLGNLGRFELKELLGQGAFGRVYRAYDPQLDRFVALKVPIFGPNDTQKIQRFIAEAKAAAKLRHPNIVPTYESGQIDGQYYIAAQFVPGQTLAARIKASLPPLPLGEGRGEGSPPSPASASFRQAADYVRQLADGLAYAHKAGIVHRDIKPDNIMLDEHDVPHIMDFGLAKRLNDDANMTTDGSILGTPAYMAPEQARGDHKNVGPHSDQYSLGVVLFQLLTGKKPFEGAPYSVIAQVIAKEPPALRSYNKEIPSELEAICQIAMNKNSSERYPSCADLSADLARWLGGFETLASPLTPSQRAWRWCRRNSLVAGLLATAILSLTFAFATSGALILSLAKNPQRTPEPLADESPAQSTEKDSQPLALADLLPAAMKAESSVPQAAQTSTSPPLAENGPVPVPLGLIAWWSADGHAADYLGANNGALEGGATFAPGLVGQAFNLDGVDDCIRVPNSAALNPSEGITMEGWIQSATTDSIRIIVSKWNHNRRDWSFSFHDHPQSDHLRLMLTAGNEMRGDLADFFGQEKISRGTWMHVAASYDKQAAKIYVNGQLDAEFPVSSPRRIRESTTDLLIGAFTNSDGKPSGHFCGLIDELSLYNRALTDSEIASIHRAGASGKIKPDWAPPAQTAVIGASSPSPIRGENTAQSSLQAPPASILASESKTESFVIEAPLLNKSPTVDGNIDVGEYPSALSVDFTDQDAPGTLFIGTVANQADLGIELYACHTSTDLFIAFKVIDDFLTSDSGADSVELFFDGDREPNDFRPVISNPGNKEGFQLTCDVNGKKKVWGKGISINDWSAIVSRGANAYIVEFRIPLMLIDVLDGPNFKEARTGAKIRFNAGFVDNDTNGTRLETYGVLWSIGAPISPFQGGETLWTAELSLSLPKPASR